MKRARQDKEKERERERAGKLSDSLPLLTLG